MAQSKLNKLLKAIELLDFQILLDLASKNRSKKDSFTFYDACQKASETELNLLVGGLNQLLIKLMEQKLGSSNSANWAALNKESWSEVGHIIQAAIDFTTVIFQYDFDPPAHVVQMAVLFNGIILQLPHSLNNVKNSIAHFCEKCSSASAAMKSHYFLFNVLIYLLRRTLDKKALKADVKRIYNLRNSIRNIMAMNQANTAEIWELFKQCFLSSLYLAMNEGQKILSLAMTLDIDRIAELHNIIYKNFHNFNPLEATSYGKIYFEAWAYCFKIRKRDMLNVLEITCLQEYILLGINNHRKPYVPLVRKFLGQFHCHKKEFEVAKMLYLLYQPLLWRFLKNPNGQTRSNAAQLFIDIFPLEDPDVKLVATDLELNDQLLLIKDLLTDEHPIVRVTTTVGLCVQMSVNWEIFPEEMLKTYFRIFVNELSHDSTSCEVRCAVARGVKVLLENPLTANTLQNILPKLSGLFHDNSENVRIAFCNVLLRVKTIAYIKYFDIVPLKQLLARMEEDCHAVKKSIANLICNSYFPKTETPKIWLARCLQIMHPPSKTAARVFFSYAVNFIGVYSSVKFILVAIRALHFYVKTKKTSTQICSYMESNNKENEGNSKTLISLEDAVGFKNTQIVCSLLNCLAVMWLSLKQDVDKPENKKYLKLLVGKVAKPLADLCHHYKNTPVWNSIFFISSFLPANVVPSLGSLCFLRLKNLPPDAQLSEYFTLLESLCNQQQGFELMKLLKSWIEVGLEDSYSPPPVKKRKSLSKNGESVYFDVPKPYLANEMMNALFSHRGLQKAVLSHGEILKEMLYFVDDIKRKLEKNSAKTMSEDEVVFLRLLLFNIIRLAVFLHDERLEGGIKFITDLVQWTEKKLFKNLKVTEKKRDVFTDAVSDCCKNLCQVLADVSGLGYCDPNSCVYLKFFEKILKTGYREKFAVITAKFLYKYAACSQFLYLDENEPIMIQNLLEHLCTFFECYNDKDFLNSLAPNEVKELQFILSSIMQIVRNHVPLFFDPSSEVFKSIIKFIINGTLDKTKTQVAKLICEPFDEIAYPSDSAFFLAVLTLKPRLIPLYMKFLLDFFRNDNKDNQDVSLWISCWVLLNNLLGIKNLTKSILNEAHILINAIGKKLFEIYPKQKPSEPTEKRFNGDISGPEKERNPEVQVFQEHCYSEFIRLKSQLYSKLCAARKSLQ